MFEELHEQKYLLTARWTPRIANLYKKLNGTVYCFLPVISPGAMIRVLEITIIYYDKRKQDEHKIIQYYINLHYELLTTKSKQFNMHKYLVA